MNNENLKSLRDRPKDERQRIAKKGGQKSGEIRRRTSAIKRILLELTSARVSDKKLEAALEGLGVEPTYLAAIAYSIIIGAIRGRSQSIDAFMKYSGQDELYNARLKKAGAEDRQRDNIETSINELICALSVRAADDWAKEEEKEDETL